MATKESSYEKVETVSVDPSGHAHLTKDIRSDFNPGSTTDTFVRTVSDKELRQASVDRDLRDRERDLRHSTTTRVTGGSSGGVGYTDTVTRVERDSAGFPLTTEYTTTTSRSTSGGSGGTLSNAVRKVEHGVRETATNVRDAGASAVRKVESGLGLRDRDGIETSHTSSSSRHYNGGASGVSSSHHRSTIMSEGRVSEGRMRVVPIVAHHQREEHEVIQHVQRQQRAETTHITIPTTRFESARMASTRKGVTYTEDKELTIPAPVVAPQIQAHASFSFGGGTHADIKATTAVNLASEVEIVDMGPEEYARYRAKVEELAHQHELETSQKAAIYREQVEKDAEHIRQTLERQHIRDIEFRKDMLEAAVDRQSVEIQLEAEYALRALEHERDAARAALEAARMSTNIDVNIESAVGVTRSQGSVITTSETRSESRSRGSPSRI